MYEWLGFIIIIIGGGSAVYTFVTRSNSKCTDPNLENLIMELEKLDKKSFEEVRALVCKLRI